jgi:hypothetical protein
MEYLEEWELAGETEVPGENLAQFHSVQYKIPHGLTSDRTRIAAVESRRLTAGTIVRLFFLN